VTAELPLARVTVRHDVREPDAWYWDVPAVAQLRAEGMPLAPVTVLVGENGSGKSTLVESVARAWQDRLTAQVHHWGDDPFAEDASLWRELEFDAPWPRPQGGIWLRGEAMHERFAGIDSDAFELRPFDGVPLNARSHGEGFLAFLESRTLERGLWILDEPESALSFRSSLRLLALLHAVAREWADLDLVQDWTAFFDDPPRLLHHLLDD
jgi:predicted ATPase